MHNDTYRVRLAIPMLTVERWELMRELFPERPHGVSVWIEKVKAGRGDAGAR